MRREELKAWAESLKPGDKVVQTEFWDERPVDILTVERLTKTGRVVTNKGTYHMTSEWSRSYRGYGSAKGTIIPATAENMEEAKKYKKEEDEKRKIARTISEAKSIAYNLRYGGIDMTYSLAKELIELVRREVKK